jgi:hypothetical protein
VEQQNFSPHSKIFGLKEFFSRMKRHFGIFSLAHPRSNVSCGSFFRNQFLREMKRRRFFPTYENRSSDNNRAHKFFFFFFYESLTSVQVQLKFEFVRVYFCSLTHTGLSCDLKTWIRDYYVRALIYKLIWNLRTEFYLFGKFS